MTGAATPIHCKCEALILLGKFSEAVRTYQSHTGCTKLEAQIALGLR